MKVNNVAVVLNKVVSIVQCILGGVGLFIFGVSFLGNIFDPELQLDSASIVLFIIFISLSVYTLYCGIKRSKMGKKLKNYVNIVGNRAIVPILEIAQTSLEPEMQVLKDFQWLIKKNFFADAYIDYDDKAIVLREAYSKILEQREREEQAKKRIEYVAVRCECCHGTTKIEKGKVGKCSYCGAPITLDA